MGAAGSDCSERLRLAPGLVIRPIGGQVELRLGHRRNVASTRVLSILEHFSRPASIAEVLERLAAIGIEDFIHATSLILRLKEEGVLLGEEGTHHFEVDGFDAPWEHVAMLDDAVRTRAFARAIREAVRPGDVVVDIGTGTGVLALEAARAGARRVYAIEQGQIASAAEQVFAANGVSDRAQIVRGRSTSVELPERADVLMSETLGNDPLAEDIVPTFRDARRRLLKADARLVPRGLDVLVVPVDLPDEFLSVSSFTSHNIARWRDELGVELQPLIDYASRISRLPSVKPRDVAHWKAIAAPVHLAHIDLFGTEVSLAGEATFVAVSSAKSLGLLLYFDADLGAGITLSTAPSAAAPTSWFCRVVRVRDRPSVAAGEAVQIEFSGTSGQTLLRAR
jgi:protein arginine N-methyltransferase 1